MLDIRTGSEPAHDLEAELLERASQLEAHVARNGAMAMPWDTGAELDMLSYECLSELCLCVCVEVCS